MAEKRTQQKLVPLVVRLPPEMHAKLKAMAEKDLRSLNTQIILLLRKALAEK